MKGIVIKKNANLFTIESDSHLFHVSPSGKTKENGVFVGDIVEFNDAITKVYERKNLLIRPPLANIDRLFIVVCPSPKPDFVLVDKIIVYCLIKGIEPIIIINKVDLANEKFVLEIEEDYKNFKIVKTSAKQGLIDDFKKEVVGVCAFSGQSAVGKSSLINTLFEEEKADVGNLSKKIERGKQTTRIVSLYKYNDGYIADTAGFSMLDLSFVSNIEERELASYYPDFLEGRGECRYRSCLHESGECGVLQRVKKGEISKRRYDNYLKILQEIRNGSKIYRNKG